MECREAEWLIDAYLDRTLSARVAEDVESHLQTCAACREHYGPMMELLASPNDVEVPAGLRDRIVAAVAGAGPVTRVSAGRLEAGVKPADRRRFRWVAWGGAVAASVAFFAVGWMGAGWFGQRPSPKPEKPPQTVVLSPWMLSSWAQAMAMRAPVNPAVFVAQATLAELYAKPTFDAVPVDRARRETTNREAPQSRTNPPAPDIPVLPPILRL